MHTTQQHEKAYIQRVHGDGLEDEGCSSRLLCKGLFELARPNLIRPLHKVHDVDAPRAGISALLHDRDNHSWEGFGALRLQRAGPGGFLGGAAIEEQLFCRLLGQLALSSRSSADKGMENTDQATGQGRGRGSCGQESDVCIRTTPLIEL
jgi:hypothetical protein